MSVLTKVERKGTRGILFQGLIVVVLVLGSVTMIYPFLLMTSGSIRSEMDAAQMDLVPRFLVDRTDLCRKFLEVKYCHNVAMMNRLRGYADYGFAQATIPPSVSPRQVEDLQRFVDQTAVPDHWWVLGGTEMVRRAKPANLYRFTAMLKQRYDGDLAQLGEDLGAPIARWQYVSLRIPEWTSPRFGYPPSRFYDVYFELLHERPLAERAFASVTGSFLENIIYPRYGRSSVEAYNADHTVPIADYHDLTLPARAPGPDQPALRAQWIAFVTGMLNNSFVRSDASDRQYQRFLTQRYRDITALNQIWMGEPRTGFDQITLPGDRDWVPAAQRQDYGAFLKSLPVEQLYLVGPEFAWHDWIQSTYGQMAQLNAAHGTAYTRWDQPRIPMPQLERAYVLEHAGSMRAELSMANFRDVINEVMLQGRPLVNTLIFVGLTLLLSLTLQPLAAYALSRFSPPGTWKLILIFMATMAFPPMVGMIPQFLILRKLYLFNTFIALILPFLVNGYLIFLLKGFFDSLPKHLYEAALIDGASELRLFTTITLSLSKPILAVVALQTFNITWISFMYPLLVCPDPSMQVLAVWLYQFQQQATTPAVFAAILVTSIPTLLIFIFTQRTIMRGIAVPAEK